MHRFMEIWVFVRRYKTLTTISRGFFSFSLAAGTEEMQHPGESPKQFLRTFTESEHQSGQSFWSKTEGIERKESNLLPCQTNH